MSQRGASSSSSSSSENGGFDHLLEFLRNARGFDFASYKRAGLMRRVQKRMDAVGVKDFAAYVEYLEVHPVEFEHLFNTILINVTSFFRDAPVWAYLREALVPRILEAAGPERPIRVWSAACASGEEPYGLAILFAEAMGLAEACRRVKIYATDVDEDAMAKGRQAVYGERDLGEMDAALRERYFDRTTGERYALARDLRRCVIFGRNDLFQDAPISRVDLLMCRNALMYFNAEAQDRILARFHFAMGEGGYLVLGKAETLLTRANLFTPVDLRLRVFQKVSRMNVRDRLLMLAKAGRYAVAVPPAPPAPAGGANGGLQDASFGAGPVAQVVIGLDGTLALANDRARALFNLTTGDLGRPLQDLELSYRPVELRSIIEQVHARQSPVLVRDIEWTSADQTPRYFDLQVDTLIDSSGAAIGMSATFTDVTHHHVVQADLNRSKEELEAAYAELQSTGEELETTNEELQSTVEELETTNEELQSTNEELETMNEELQSTNEELQTMNDELRLRTDELNEVNLFMSSILGSLQLGVVVVDGELRVRAWNPRAEDLWGLRADEVQGKFLLNLDIGLPVEKLRQSLRDAASGAATAGAAPVREVLLAATNRRGKPFQCRVTFGPLAGADGRRPGVVLLMDEYAPDGGPPRDGDGKGSHGG
jgi:two-component system CheB/CheR fusion protein